MMALSSVIREVRRYSSSIADTGSEVGTLTEPRKLRLALMGALPLRFDGPRIGKGDQEEEFLTPWTLSPTRRMAGD